MTRYFLVVYVYRRVGQPTWQIANEVHSGSLASWFEEQRAFGDQESKLLWMRYLRKSVYDELKDQLS